MSDERPIVEVERYLGLWYEFARTPNSFQDNEPTRDGERLTTCINTTAEYQLREDGDVTVTNTCRRYGVRTGKLYKSVGEGLATVKNKDNNILRVRFGGAVARFFQDLFSSRSGYWIYALGEPTTENGLYEWSLVSGPDKDYIWILTREQFPSQQVIDAAYKAAVKFGLPVDELTCGQSQGCKF